MFVPVQQWSTAVQFGQVEKTQRSIYFAHFHNICIKECRREPEQVAFSCGRYVFAKDTSFSWKLSFFFFFPPEKSVKIHHILLITDFLKFLYFSSFCSLSSYFTITLLFLHYFFLFVLWTFASFEHNWHRLYFLLLYFPCYTLVFLFLSDLSMNFGNKTFALAFLFTLS